jgi:hypothetical protein
MATETKDRCQFDRAMDALDLLERMLDAVDTRARRILATDDEEPSRPEGDQP